MTRSGRTPQHGHRPLLRSWPSSPASLLERSSRVECTGHHDPNGRALVGQDSHPRTRAALGADVDVLDVRLGLPDTPSRSGSANRTGTPVLQGPICHGQFQNRFRCMSRTQSISQVRVQIFHFKMSECGPLRDLRLMGVCKSNTKLFKIKTRPIWRRQNSRRSP